MFGDLNKSIKEGQERWKKIEELQGNIEYALSNNDLNIEAVAHLLILIVEHLRPMNPSQEQLDEATSGLADLLKALKK